MPVLKNLRHEFFVREYIKTGCSNAGEAYRRAWELMPPPRHGVLAPNSYRRCGFKVRHRRDVQARLEEIQTEMIKRSDITLENILTGLQEAYDIAKRNVKTADMISAKVAQGKAVGLFRERVETGNVGEFDGIEDVNVILERLAANPEAGPQKAQELADALGISWSADGGGVGVEEEAEASPMDEPPPSDSLN